MAQRAATRLKSAERQADQRLRSRPRITAGTIAWYVTAIVLAMIFFAPFLWLFRCSLMTDVESAAFQIDIWPSHAFWQNFSNAFTWTTLPDPNGYLDMAWHSIRLAAYYAGLVTFTSAMVGFAFARLKGPGKQVMFALMVSTMMIPGIIYVWPQFIMYTKLGLIYSDWPWVFNGLAVSPYLAFLYRQFFSTIPVELEDAAIVDGCGYVRIFWQIFLPLSKPAIATAAVFSSQYVWNDYVTPSIFLLPTNTTLAYAIGGGGYTDPHGNPLYGLLSAGAFYYMIPMLLLFFVAQRYFISGSLSGSIKG